MGNVRFTEDFKIEAIKQVIERGYPLGSGLPLHQHRLGFIPQAK